MGYTNASPVTSRRIVIRTEDELRVSSLMHIADELNGHYTNQKNGVGWRSSAGAAIMKDGFVIIAKPQTSGISGNISELDVRYFCNLGESNSIYFRGKSSLVKTFTSARVIEKSILEGCLSHPYLSDAYFNAFRELFDSEQTHWTNTETAIRNKLGVYVGELLIGWALLKGNLHLFQDAPHLDKVCKFHILTDPTASGFDSIVEYSNGDLQAISSKFGSGAKASFFTNVFKNGIETSGSLEHSFFRKLCEFSIGLGISHKNARDFVYSYGVREILGIPDSKLENPISVFNQIKYNNIQADAQIVIDAIAKITTDEDIKENLPKSVSMFFNRYLSKNLNSDANSINQMTKIIAGKDFLQVNLNIAKWNKGEMLFRFMKSSETNLKIISNKSAVADIVCKQGWLNYNLSK